MASPISISHGTNPAITSSVRYSGDVDMRMYAYLYVDSATYNPTNHTISFTYHADIQTDPSSTWLPVDAVSCGIDSYDNLAFCNNGEGTIWHNGSFSSMPYRFATGSGSFSATGSTSKNFYVKMMSLASGYRSSRWNAGSYCYTGSASISFTVPKKSVSVTYGTGGSSVTGGGSYTYGESVTVTATAETGYHFVRWEEGGSSVSTSRSYTFEATSNRTLTAVFAADTYTVQYAVNAPSGASGTIPSAPANQTKTYGSGLSLRPAINGLTMIPPYNFKGWLSSSDNTVYQGGATYNKNAASTMSAQWEIAYLKPTINTDPIPVVSRCDSSGVISDTGEYVYVSVAGTYDSTFITSPSGSVTITLKYRESGSSADYSTATLVNNSATLSSGTYTLSSYTAQNLFDTDKAYQIKLLVQDNSGQTYTPNDFTTFLSTTYFPMDIDKDGTSFAFGMAAPSVPSGSNGMLQINGGWSANLPKKVGQWSTASASYAPMALCPVGTIVAFGGANAPSGWLICNGQSFSSSDYPDLYLVLGTNTVPDLRGRVAIGVGNVGLLSSKGSAVDSNGRVTSQSGGDGSTQGHKLTARQVPGMFWHTDYVSGDNFNNSVDPGSYWGFHAQPSRTLGDSHSHDLNSHTHDVTMPCVGLNYIIYAGGAS